MNNKQVAHLWANKSRSSAKGNHFYFEGDTIYSYGAHFPIARHYKGTVLFTTKSYSVSTARHISYARMAVNHLKTFTVSNVLENPSGDDVRRYADEVEQLATEVSRAHDPQWKLQQLQQLVNEANDFCKTFGFKTRFAMPDETTLAKLKEKSRIAIAKKATATAERNARIERENIELVNRWLAGESVSLPYSISKVYLRSVSRAACDSQTGMFNPGEQIASMETSRGAIVPLADAEKAFRFVMIKRSTGWHRNGERFSIGEFQLDAVNEQGVVAGCHRVSWEEIERFAKQQGWL